MVSDRNLRSVWLKLELAQDESATITSRRLFLAELREMLGTAAFYCGELPYPVRFPEEDRP
jgi:hypothetical protein